MKPASRNLLMTASAALAIGLAALAGEGLTQSGALAVLDPALDAASAQRDMALARRESDAARQRAERLEAKARQVSEQAEKTARETAAIAARIQQTEAAIAAQKAQVRLIALERIRLRERLAEKQAPLARLTGSLQRLSRRPPLLAVLRPGSVRDAVYLRAVMDTMLPEVERRTKGLRAEIERGRALEQQARAAGHQLAQMEGEMRQRRRALAALESRQRLAGRAASGIAAREGERAVALAEKARDLSDLVDRIGEQGALREQLAALPGPTMRPPRPEEARVIGAAQFVPVPEGLASYMLPATGRLLTGFGEILPGQAPSKGLTLATRAHAQVVSPAAGRVAFAGPYRGYGQIVIIEHRGGWTSLLTGLTRLDAQTGRQVVAGAPIGTMGPKAPRIMVELRRQGQAVNPLQYIRSL
ncbi:murein hydrolase activator EnvC family protein [Novosphingobium lindaniclasticum]|uniref:murein hydrolase activator EnvC family protein n=1 Tax=Novosphingobium lindaniclasticum TaxID=1329895 RepID=UPI0024093BE4|nr:peptidoglycan DD-metalloendopeptidase family protein [Novosphingobium lindaniclasticum]